MNSPSTFSTKPPTMTAAVGDEPRWTVTIDHGAPAHHADLEDALTALLPHPHALH